MKWEFWESWFYGVVRLEFYFKKVIVILFGGKGGVGGVRGSY